MDGELRWVEEARAGSAPAFSQLVRAHQAAVRAYLGRYLRDSEAADDLAQETFLAAWRTLSTWKGESPLRLWLLGIARHRALSHLRDEERRRAKAVDSVDAVLAPLLARRAEADAPEVHERRVAALRGCLETLPPASASIVDEFYFRNRSANELARSAGKSENAIWMALMRVRLALRRCVEGRLA
jgi:RNA polymerase sigma-70 factor (ECF subfamily)